MDELGRVRELYGEPSLDPLARARVRERLTAAPRRRRRRLTGMVALAGAVAVAAATLIALPDPEISGPGRSILLAAAHSAESGGEVSGAYWRVRKLIRRTYPERLGSGYWMVESRLAELWVARDGRVWAGARSLGVRPRTPADELAWRKDGAPTAWPGLPGDPGKGTLTATGGVPFSMAGQGMTIDQIRDLPADPGRLRALVEPLGEGLVADALSGLLWSKPSPPEVRAAAYRALADLPEVRYLGERTDEQGRRGAAFSFALPDPPGTRRTLIIDSATSRVLSSVTDAPGILNDQTELVLEAGWTDRKPAAP
ncbi:CU044_5270 family protein [Acrocarpospora catenulata]|uniref:CU044_5270 family protein n=1 Tax=Acrocarpospora catenulata TaxID=2836182 RepID=UPI001BDAA194|nr:CU044_5270 family protein [Acrocarpospora catenulata]